MEREEVLSSIIEMIKKSLINPPEIGIDDRLEEDLGLDSIGFIELSTGLEKKYRVDISDEDVENCKTVREVLDLAMDAPILDLAEDEV